jgi:hypothetical protein
MAELVLDDSLLATVQGRVAVVVGMWTLLSLKSSLCLHRL